MMGFWSGAFSESLSHLYSTLRLSDGRMNRQAGRQTGGRSNERMDGQSLPHSSFVFFYPLHGVAMSDAMREKKIRNVFFLPSARESISKRDNIRFQFVFFVLAGIFAVPQRIDRTMYIRFLIRPSVRSSVRQIGSDKTMDEHRRYSGESNNVFATRSFELADNICAQENRMEIISN